MSRRIHIVICIAILLVSCKKDFLEKEPNNALPDETAFLNIKDIRTGLTGCYRGIENVNYYGKNFVLYPEVASDNMKINLSRTTGRFLDEYFYSMKASSSNPSGLWITGYDVIHRANKILQALPGIKDGTTEEKKIARGEALAIRAMAHFDLVRAFAQPYNSTPGALHEGIPVILETSTELFPAKNTVAEVYARVMLDLSEADTLIITERSGDPYYISKNAIRALMARVYLYEEDWANAAKQARWIIDSTTCALIANADYIGSWLKEFNDEAIFELGFLTEDYLVTDALGFELLDGGYGDIIPTSDIVNLYGTNDVRKNLFLQGTGNATYCNKYPGRGKVGLDNVKVIRLSEMYLIAAEAYAEMGDNTNAQKYLDFIRQRADLTAPATTETGDALKDLIQQERRKELAFEGQRLFDLTRRKKGVSRTDCISGVCSKSYDVIEERQKFVMPIPQRELDVNKSLIQNKGY